MNNTERAAIFSRWMWLGVVLGVFIQYLRLNIHGRMKGSVSTPMSLERYRVPLRRAYLPVVLVGFGCGVGRGDTKIAD